MNIKEYIKSESFRGILIGLVMAIVALVIFQAGIAIGERKASFAHRFGDNFERNFRDPRGGGFLNMRGGPGGDMPGGHGAVGEIVSIALPTVVVAGPDNLEKTVVIGKDTLIRQFQYEATETQLEEGDFIVVLGNPNEEGQIEARLIRVVPPPPGFTNTDQ